MKRIVINLNANGEGTLHCQGFKVFKCLGKAGFAYKTTSIVIHPNNANEKQRHHYSREYNNYDMEFSLMLDWTKGVYIHAGGNRIATNDGYDSAGCIHLEYMDARVVYNWVNERTSVIIKKAW